MAFRPLTDAECGQINPLAQLASHVTQDHAFSDTHGQLLPPVGSEQWVDHFLQDNRAPQSFRMDDLLREMHEIESQKLSLPPVPAIPVKEHLHDGVWAQQLIEEGQLYQEFNAENSGASTSVQKPDENLNEIDDFEPQVKQPPIRPPIHSMQMMSPFQSNWGMQYLNDGATFHHDNQNYKDIWAEIYSQEQQSSSEADFSDVQKSAEEFLNSVDDQKFVYSKFMNFMDKVKEGDVNLESGKLTESEASKWSEEFLNAQDTLAESWVKEQTQEESKDDFNARFWNNLEAEMKKVVDYEEGSDHPWLTDYEDYTLSHKEYEFSEENPMFDVNNPLDRGKELLNQGDLPGAVLCFEAAVKKDSESVEAWLLLGTTQAENEQDPLAISALQKCLQLQPDNMEALMALSSCYTNESYYNQACEMLLLWLKSNPKYATIVPPDFKLTGDRSKFVQDLFIKAAQMQPNNLDYEVQCGLGVLFNLSGDYQKAADCFRAALSAKPDDAKLWNKLGATLANGSRPEEAVDAYREALNLSPGFIRARYNVGITCINLSAYEEAAKHLLLALTQQARGKDPARRTSGVSQMSDTIWSTLRMCISLLGRPNLKEAVDNRDLSALNKEFDIK